MEEFNYYDQNGGFMVSEVGGPAYAKHDGKYYYIKKCTAGANAGNFANPYGATYNPREFTAYDSHSGRNYYEYAKVSENVFNDYLKFLQSRNQSHYLNAQREYKNGNR